ncbi:maleylpyruvate isomerase N-terminal domain-containing protein [Actinophytocola sp.]|uniref:maleylpyruvate isomerase N-terminal domain-containing protein n=1 Tax=Actinophytocola sp. TaxID=1872138 RepID=UPI002ED1F2FD
MDFDVYLEHVREQAAALRAAAVKAGPGADMPTAPGWTVRHLVRHIARVHDWVRRSLDTDPAEERPGRAQPPEDWDGTLAFWDETLDGMLHELRKRGPASPAWTFSSDKTVGFWARRQAHETAIHRLDAEHAAHGDAVDHLVFDPELAADGIDEALTLMIARNPVEVSGTVLIHAADAGRAWLVTLTAGKTPNIGRATEIDTDASLVGTADAVYRAIWGRPSHAVVSGDSALVAALRTP